DGVAVNSSTPARVPFTANVAREAPARMVTVEGTDRTPLGAASVNVTGAAAGAARSIAPSPGVPTTTPAAGKRESTAIFRSNVSADAMPFVAFANSASNPVRY